MDTNEKALGFIKEFAFRQPIIEDNQLDHNSKSPFFLSPIYILPFTCATQLSLHVYS